MNRLESARVRTDALFDMLDPAALYARPVPERHRLIFYLGHVEAFDWNLLGETPVYPTFDRLFAFGIDPAPGAGPADQPGDWPSEKEVRSYVARVREKLNGTSGHIRPELMDVAVEHRLMHAETLAYLIHNLPYDLKRGPRPAAMAEAPAANDFVDVSSGVAWLGRERGDGFGWDNEFDRHAMEVAAFRISRFKISNGEYLQFVRAGAPDPHFWIDRGGSWFLRAMFGEIPLPLDWPVYVTHAEASAYAQWRGARLPAEAQFHRAAEGSHPVNADFESWDPVAVGRGGASACGAVQMIGNGWEWTSTVFAPFPGFEPFPFYRGYSADFFDGQHYVMKGGSPRTAQCMLRASFRNWFRADYPHVYAGFRLVEAQ